MLIEANGIVYKLYFRRNTKVRKHKIDSGPGYSVTVQKREVATTAILECESEGTSYVGMSVCGIFDVFNKETGRVLAMKDAMKDIPREVREIIWARYHDRKTNVLSPDSILVLLTKIEALSGLPQGTLTSHLIPTKDEKVDQG